MRPRELAEKKAEEEQDYWFNRVRPMTKPKQMWQEKRLAKEENGSSGNSSGEEEVEVTSTKGDSNSGSGSGNPESGNRNSSEKEDRREEESTWMDVNMVFMIPVKFHAPLKDITELALGVEHFVFEKPKNPSAHMKPLFIWGHLDGTPVRHMLVDGGASVNIFLLSPFKKLGHIEGDFKRTNLSINGFADDPMEAKGIICKELTVGSKTMHTAFFVVDVKGRYNVLLG
jgi:ribonucleotide reductase alpha subunit